MRWPTIDDMTEAKQAVYRYMKPTPLYEWPSLSRRLGFRFFLKHENHTPTTAFKVRGGLNLVSRLSDEQKKQGIIGCTTGNHGQSLAYACKQHGVRCVLVVPAKNNPDKVAAMRNWGAEIIEHGRDYDEARSRCEEITQREPLRYVHSANEPDLIAGVGTYALEIFEELSNPDYIFVPVGLGSGICGTAIAAAKLNPATKVIGVQSEAAPAVTMSWREGKPVETESANTFAEGMATRISASLTLEIMQKHVHDMVLVSEDALRESIRWLLQDTHNLAEGAGAASPAAAFQMRERLAGKTVVGILTGGNLDMRELTSILSNSVGP